MNKATLSILLFIASAVAKGRGGGSSTTAGDNWDAPPLLKAYMAFEIICAALSLVQFVWILASLRKIPSMAARGPYIMLAIVTFFAFVLYLMAGISTRISDDMGWIAAGKFSASITACYALVTAFQPAVVLWLIHQRGALLRASTGNAISPFTSQLWKQIVDWVLVGITFIIYFASVANRAAFFTNIDKGVTRDIQQYIQQFLKADHALGHTLVALSVLLAINVAASSITLLVQGKRAQWNDMVTARVCQIIVPFYIVYALETLIFDIYYTKVTSSVLAEDALLGVNIANIIIDGFCRLAITSVLIITMSLPGVQWTPARGVPLYPGSPGSWPNSKHEGSQVSSTPQQI